MERPSFWFYIKENFLGSERLIMGNEKLPLGIKIVGLLITIIKIIRSKNKVYIIFSPWRLIKAIFKYDKVYIKGFFWALSQIVQVLKRHFDSFLLKRSISDKGTCKLSRCSVSV